MYYKYDNLKLIKQKNFVEISVNQECVLENFEDDNARECRIPQFIVENLRSKLLLNNFDIFSISLLKISSPNRITDHKKIWSLGGFESRGEFDGQYDAPNGRIYFGVQKGDSKSKSILVKEIKLFVPQNLVIECQTIFEWFCKCAEKDIDNDMVDILIGLQKIINFSIIFYHSPFSSKFFLFGEGVEQKIERGDFPQNAVIEKVYI